MSQKARLKTPYEFAFIEKPLSVALGTSQEFFTNHSTRYKDLSSFNPFPPNGGPEGNHTKNFQTGISSASCLVLESNAIIFIDLEEILKSLGVGHIDHAATVAEAMQFLDRKSYGFAVIDFDPDVRSFAPVLEKLAILRINFAAIVFSDDEAALLNKKRSVPIIIKPFSASDVATALGSIVDVDIN